MQSRLVGPTLRRALWVLMAVAFGLSGPAYAQEPEPELDPDPEPQAEEFDEEELLDTDAITDEEPEADATVDEEEAVDAAEDDDEWWVEVAVDESDDAVPVDTELDPTGAGWEIVEYANDGDGIEDVPAESAEGVREPGDMPTIKPRVRPARPPEAGEEDSPYSMGGKPVRDTGAAWQAQIFYPGNGHQELGGEAPERHAVMAAAALLRRHADRARLGADRRPLH